MEQLNRKRQNEDARYDRDVENRQTRPPNIKYHDSQAQLRQRLPKGIAFADIVRNKSAPPSLKKETETNIPSEIYEEKITLESFKSDLIVFKNLLYDARSLTKVESKDFTGLLTVRDYSNKLSTNNEKYKYR